MDQPASTTRRTGQHPIIQWISLLLTVMLLPFESLMAGPDKDVIHAHWLFASHRKQGHKLLPLAGGPRIELRGPIVLADDPLPPRVDLKQSAGRLFLADKQTDASLPPDLFCIEAWVRIDEVDQSGGIISATHPEGVTKGGWHLGHQGGRLEFSILPDHQTLPLTLKAGALLKASQWHHIVVNVGPEQLALWVDGEPEGEVPRPKTTIKYPESLHYELGNWIQEGSVQPLKGSLHEVYLLNQPASMEAIQERHQARKAYFPPAGPEPIIMPIALGPFVDWTGRTSVRISWNCDEEMPTRVDLMGPEGEFREFASPTLSEKHQVEFNNIQIDGEYSFRIHGPMVGKQAQFSQLYRFDSSFYYAPLEPASPQPEGAPITVSSKLTEQMTALLNTTENDKGFALIIGASSQQLMRASALAKLSQLKIILVDESASAVADARAKLDAAGLYGERVSVHHSELDSLPYGPFFANLILVEETNHLTHSLDINQRLKQLARHLRPAGGSLCIHRSNPSSVTDAELETALSSLDLKTESSGVANNWWLARRGILPGSGDWSHQYGGADNSSCSQDELVSGELGVLWWGDPGPRPMPDRGPRNPAPISVNGRLYIQGDRILFGLDAYNGTILWNYFSPEMRRANLPRDCSNMIGTHDYLYVAQGRHCLGIEGHTGRRELIFETFSEGQSPSMDWGYLATYRDMLIGSSVKAGSGYLGDDGEWFEDDHPEDISRVVSAHLFAVDRHDGNSLWSYTGGAIINSTITIGDEEIFFLESQNPAAIHAETGRLKPEELTDVRLVCLDLRSGKQSWERVHDFSDCRFMTYMTYSNDTLVVAGADKDKHYHTYAFNTRPQSSGGLDQSSPPLAAGSLLWEESHEAGKNHHSGHLQHPVVIGDTFYSDQRAFNLRDGALLRSDLPERRGCGTMSAALNSIFYRHYYHGQWDLQSNRRTQFEGLRSGCWLGMIPAGGLLLAPEASAGCSCENAIQTSVGYLPKSLDPAMTSRSVLSR